MSLAFNDEKCSSLNADLEARYRVIVIEHPKLEGAHMDHLFMKIVSVPAKSAFGIEQ